MRASLGSMEAPRRDRRRRLLVGIGLGVLLVTSAACGGTSQSEQAAAELEAGLAAHQQGDLATAAAHYEEALVLDPNNKYAYYNLGLIDQTNGDLESAETNYRQALTIDPSFVTALYNLAIVRHDLGDLDESIALYRQVVSLQPDHAAAHLNLGFALKEAGMEREGDAELQVAVQLDPALAARIPAESEAGETTEPTEESESP